MNTIDSLKRYFTDCMSFCYSFKLCAFTSVPVEPGKFDLVYQNPDGTERVEYAVSRDSRVSLPQNLQQNDHIHMTQVALLGLKGHRGSSFALDLSGHYKYQWE